MGGHQSSHLNTPVSETASEWQPSSNCLKHIQAARSDDTCMVKIAANAHFDINYRPTFQTLFSDKDTILYQSFCYDCQGKQLPAGIFYILRKSSQTLKSLTLNNLPNDCRICIYDLFRKLQLDQYKELEQLVLSRMYKDECYIKLSDDLTLPYNVTHLTLYGIGLVSIPTVIVALKSLTHLSLANNIITSISCLLEGENVTLSNLVSVNVAENLLTAVPKDIDRLSNLKVLNLSHNCLKKTVPDSIGNLRSLTELFLQWNRLESIPSDVLANLKSLRLLNLSHNKLKDIARDICFHSSLKLLSLAGNEGLAFHQTAKEVSTTPPLEELDISATMLCFLPSFLTELRELRVLNCNSNQISNIDIILTIDNLQTANFRCNNISDCSKVFCYLHATSSTKLTALDLTDNNMTTENGEESIKLHNTMVVLHSRSDIQHTYIAPRRSSSKPSVPESRIKWLCCL